MYLKIQNVTKEFDNIEAVKDFSLEVSEGELVSLLGPSGCGKTTMLRMIGGFLNPNKGSIYLENNDITKIPPEKRPVSTVFQNYALFPHLNVLDNVTYGLKNNKELSKKSMIDKANEMIDIVGMSDFKNRSVTELSGGQQQRVALARSLVLGPKVLLMDEPLSNLDAKLRLKMREEIKKIQKELKITMIFVTHDQEEAISISDRIVVMNKGEIKQIGSPREIYEHPNNIFVANFIGRANILNLADNKIIVRPENVELGYNEMKYKGQIVEKNYLGFFTSYSIKTTIFDMEYTIFADLIGTNKNFEINDEVYFDFKFMHPIK